MTNQDLTGLLLCADLDGVCGDYETALRAVVARELGRAEADMGRQTAWDFEQTRWGITSRDQFLELHELAVTSDRIFRTMGEIPGASDVLWRLSDRGAHIRIVTHRLVNHGNHDLVVSDTVAWLQERRPDGRPRIPYRDICFMGAKPDVAGDVIVDDAPHNVEQLRAARERGKPAPQPIVFDQPYNSHVLGPRALSWDDVDGYVTAFQQWRKGNPLAM